MKIIQKLLFFITALLALFCGFIIICAMKPEITEAISGFLYPGQKQTVVEESTEETDVQTEADEPQTETEDEESGVPDNQTQNSQESDSQTSSGQETDGQTLENSPVSDGQEELSEEEPVYVAPSTSSVVVPSKVAGKNGYEQVRYEVEQLGEEAAEKLQQQLEVGDAGDGLDFDTDYYPYYAMLDKDGQHLYRQIYANANNLFKTFAPVEMVSTKELKDIF